AQRKIQIQQRRPWIVRRQTRAPSRLGVPGDDDVRRVAIEGAQSVLVIELEPLCPTTLLERFGQRGGRTHDAPRRIDCGMGGVDRMVHLCASFLSSVAVAEEDLSPVAVAEEESGRAYV